MSIQEITAIKDAVIEIIGCLAVVIMLIGSGLWCIGFFDREKE